MKKLNDVIRWHWLRGNTVVAIYLTLVYPLAVCVVFVCCDLIGMQTVAEAGDE